LSEKMKARVTGTRPCIIANADDTRETAISIFGMLALLADGISAAAYNWDLGTSRWQLAIRLHQLAVKAEGTIARKIWILSRYGPCWPVLKLARGAYRRCAPRNDGE
jgi:hypothetical protein